jgi:hypothetical protein
VPLVSHNSEASWPLGTQLRGPRPTDAVKFFSRKLFLPATAQAKTAQKDRTIKASTRYRIPVMNSVTRTYCRPAAVAGTFHCITSASSYPLVLSGQRTNIRHVPTHSSCVNALNSNGASVMCQRTTRAVRDVSTHSPAKTYS